MKKKNGYIVTLRVKRTFFKLTKLKVFIKHKQYQYKYKIIGNLNENKC